MSTFEGHKVLRRQSIKNYDVVLVEIKEGNLNFRVYLVAMTNDDKVEKILLDGSRFRTRKEADACFSGMWTVVASILEHTGLLFK